MNQPDYGIAAGIAAFYMDNANLERGYWKGRLRKAKQVELFGHYFGRGTIVIDWEDETVTHHVSSSFGQDSDRTALMKWDGEVIFNTRNLVTS